MQKIENLDNWPERHLYELRSFRMISNSVGISGKAAIKYFLPFNNFTPDCIQAVFERLMLQQPGDHVITTRGSLPNHEAASAAGEAGHLYYLCHSYARAKHLLKSAIVSELKI